MGVETGNNVLSKNHNKETINEKCNVVIDKNDTINKKKYDINDYSRFDKIDVDEDDDENKDKISKEKEKENEKIIKKCGNCNKLNVPLRCSICKKISYCSRECQKEDWTFHRRICKKPEIKKDDKNENKIDKNKQNINNRNNDNNVTKSNKKSDNIIIDDEEDLKNVRGYNNGLPYFHRDLSKQEKELIGDITPQKIQVQETSPSKKMNHIISVESKNEGSAWNSAGTFEERDYTKWAKDEIERRILSIKIEDEITIFPTKIENFAGDASICVVRGKKRFLFDYNFVLHWTAASSKNPEIEIKGISTFQDISNDGNYEIYHKLEDPKKIKELGGETLYQIINKLIINKNSRFQEKITLELTNFYLDFQKQ